MPRLLYQPQVVIIQNLTGPRSVMVSSAMVYFGGGGLVSVVLLSPNCFTKHRSPCILEAQQTKLKHKPWSGPSSNHLQNFHAWRWRGLIGYFLPPVEWQMFPIGCQCIPPFENYSLCLVRWLWPSEMKMMLDYSLACYPDQSTLDRYHYGWIWNRYVSQLGCCDNRWPLAGMKPS